nr:MAG TPA: Primosomal protein dnaI N-terminal domain, helicase-loading protein [Caudoviricetes sp.]
MSCINKQSIYRAFYFLDKKGIAFRPVDGVETDDIKSIKARAALCEVWLDALQDLDEEIWNDVMRIVLAECKQYPSVEQLYEYIGRATAGKEAATNVPEEPPAVIAAPAKKVAKSKGPDERMQRMFALAKEGRWKEAAACTKAEPMEDKLEAFTKKHFPAKATLAWIEKNRWELESLMREDERCAHCFGYRRCASKGITYFGTLDKYGNIVVQGMECMKVMTNEKI